MLLITFEANENRKNKNGLPKKKNFVITKPIKIIEQKRVLFIFICRFSGGVPYQILKKCIFS